ncbi:MAG: hypothetical protein ACYDDF_10325 [Thermoplasmatota archaeon]
MMRARRYLLFISSHAYEGMNQERPPLDAFDVVDVLENPDEDDGQTAWRWVANRTILVRYTIGGETLYVRSVSCTRSRRTPMSE